MDELIFSGLIVNGIGGHSELIIPGRNDLEDAPAEWPERLFPGSLNVRVICYPPEFASRGLRSSTKVLDTAGFEPELVIPQAKMINNKLTPTVAFPTRGTAQVWRASIITEGRMIECWVLRRIGSGLADQIELVSEIKLRARLGVGREREWPARVIMQGRWQKGDRIEDT